MPREETIQRVLHSIQSAAPKDAWLSCRYLDHLSVLTQRGLVEYEPGLFSRNALTYRARLTAKGKICTAPIDGALI